MSLPTDSLVVFPLFPIVDGACGCGAHGCTRIGKHPAVAWKDLTIADRATTPRPDEGAGYGIKTGAAPKGAGVIVVDLDNVEAIEAWQRLAGDDADTFTVFTPRGCHLYFQHPGFPVGNSAGALAAGIDIRGDGGYVVGPGSPHRSGGTYEVAADVDPLPCPAWLVEWLRAREAPAEIQTYPGDVDGPERTRRRELYASWLKSEAPVRSAANRGKGDAILFEVVQRGAYDLRLPTEDVLELVREHYDHRNDRKWGDELPERVAHKAHDAKTRSTRPRAEPPPEEVAHFFLGNAVPLPPPPPPPPGAKKCAWKIRRGGWERRPPPPSYLVAGLLLERKVSMIFADSGSIKSWTAESIALAVASGEPWLGERHVHKGAVLYVDFEDAEDEFNRRVYLLNGGRPADDLCYVYQPALANVPEFWEQLAFALEDHDVKLVVIDTLAGATPDEDENDKRAALALQMAGKFSTDHEVSILFLHHSNKNGDIRGTSAFKANVDSLFSLVTIEDNVEEGYHRARLVNTKSGQRKVASLALELTDSGLRKWEEPADEKAEAAAEGETDARRTFDDVIAAVYLAIEQNGPIATQDRLRAIVGARKAIVNSAVLELQATERVAKTPTGYVVDDEDKRKARLVGCVQAHPSWGRRDIVERGYATDAFFDRAIDSGLIWRHTPGRVDTGYMVPGPVKPFPTP